MTSTSPSWGSVENMSLIQLRSELTSVKQELVQTRQENNVLSVELANTRTKLKVNDFQHNMKFQPMLFIFFFSSPIQTVKNSSGQDLDLLGCYFCLELIYKQCLDKYNLIKLMSDSQLNTLTAMSPIMVTWHLSLCSVSRYFRQLYFHFNLFR